MSATPSKRRAKPSTAAAGGQGAPPRDKGTLLVPGIPGQSQERALTENALSPATKAACISRMFSKGLFGETDITDTVAVIQQQADDIVGGDLSGLERMLTAQAITLDTMFGELARRAALNIGSHIDAAEMYTRLAFKAQAQCRATAEAIAEIKHPRAVAYVRQTNVSTAPMQVNNGTGGEEKACARARASAETPLNPTNELLGVNDGMHLDARTAGTAKRGDPSLATVDAVNGSAI